MADKKKMGLDDVNMELIRSILSERGETPAKKKKKPSKKRKKPSKKKKPEGVIPGLLKPETRALIKALDPSKRKQMKALEED